MKAKTEKSIKESGVQATPDFLKVLAEKETQMCQKRDGFNVKQILKIKKAVDNGIL